MAEPVAGVAQPAPPSPTEKEMVSTTEPDSKLEQDMGSSQYIDPAKEAKMMRKFDVCYHVKQ